MLAQQTACCTSTCMQRQAKFLLLHGMRPQAARGQPCMHLFRKTIGDWSIASPASCSWKPPLMTTSIVARPHLSDVIATCCSLIIYITLIIHDSISGHAGELRSCNTISPSSKLGLQMHARRMLMSLLLGLLRHRLKSFNLLGFLLVWPPEHQTVALLELLVVSDERKIH